jgi:hypothetical protein
MEATTVPLGQRMDPAGPFATIGMQRKDRADILSRKIVMVV